MLVFGRQNLPVVEINNIYIYGLAWLVYIGRLVTGWLQSQREEMNMK